MAISGVKNVAMKAGRGLAKARNQGATYALGGVIAAPQSTMAAMPRRGGRALPPARGNPGVTPPVPSMKKGGKTKC